MNWIQPKFSDISQQPRKKQRLDNCHSKNRYLQDSNNPKLVEPSKCLSWVEKYKPLSKSELIIHKKKIDEVEGWLQSICGDGANIMLLTGPPGSGKLTTLKVLCAWLKIQTSEWITPAPQTYDPENFTGPYCSQQRIFEEFLIRASRYSSVLSSATKRLVVVKDIPNVFLRDPPLFHVFLENFSNCVGASVVFIITESTLEFELFPETVKQNVKIKTIHFNPITKKSVTNVLTNIIRKEKLSSLLGSNVITEISETCEGDLRNAIMSLNFISTKGSKFNVPENKVKSKNKSLKNENSSIKQHLTDPSVDLFHSLGRVLYVKRNENETFVHNPNNIVDSFITNPNTFINMLQENYLTVYKDIACASKATNYLAVTDFLQFDPSDSLISKDLALSIAVRGIMCTNKLPLKKFQQFNKSKISKVVELKKSYNDNVKANFYFSNPTSIMLDSVTFLNKMSKNLESETERSIVKELSCFYLINKHI